MIMHCAFGTRHMLIRISTYSNWRITRFQWESWPSVLMTHLYWNHVEDKRIGALKFLIAAQEFSCFWKAPRQHLKWVVVELIGIFLNQLASNFFLHFSSHLTFGTHFYTLFSCPFDIWDTFSWPLFYFSPLSLTPFPLNLTPLKYLSHYLTFV